MRPGHRGPGQDLVHQRDRPDTALGLVQRLSARLRRHPPGLQAQERGDRLEVVLHPVVDLADGGVLGQQKPVQASHVGDVAEQDHGAGDRPVGHERDAVHEHHDVGSALDLLDDRPGRGEGPLDGRLLDAQVHEPATLGQRVHPHPVERVSSRSATRTRRGPRRRRRPHRRQHGVPPRSRRRPPGTGTRTRRPWRPAGRTRRGRCARSCSSPVGPLRDRSGRARRSPFPRTAPEWPPRRWGRPERSPRCPRARARPGATPARRSTSRPPRVTGRPGPD